MRYPCGIHQDYCRARDVRCDIEEGAGADVSPLSYANHAPNRTTGLLIGLSDGVLKRNQVS